MAHLHIIIDSTLSAADLQAKTGVAADNKQKFITQLRQFIGLIEAGEVNAIVVQNVGAVAPSQTFTGSTVAATNTAVVNGVTFTAVASGATGNQFNVGLNDTETMLNLANAINNSATAGIKGVVFAKAASTVVTVQALNGASQLNSLTTTATGGITAGGATMSSGAVGNMNYFNFGGGAKVFSV